MTEGNNIAVAESRAWVMDLANGQRVAVGERILIHLLPDVPKEMKLPGAPHHCQRLILWQGIVLPILDLTAWLTGATRRVEGGLLAILAFRDRWSGETHRGALRIQRPPVRAWVRDEYSCSVPVDNSGLAAAALSWFEDEIGPVPILDLGRLFGTPVGLSEVVTASPLPAVPEGPAGRVSHDFR